MKNDGVTLDQILLVDHDEERRHQLRTLLHDLSYETTEANSCEEAMVVLAKQPPALVITETILPKRSGLFLLRQVKDSLPETEVVLVTDNSSSYNVLQALRLGAFDFIVRPIDTCEILHNVLGRAFKQIQLHRQNQQLVIELVRRNSELDQRLTFKSFLIASIEKIYATNEVQSLFMELLNSSMQAIHAQKGFLALFDRQCSQLGIKVSQGIPKSTCQRYSHSLPDGLLVRLAQRGEPLWVAKELPSELASQIDPAEQNHLINQSGLLVTPIWLHDRTVGIAVLSGHPNNSPFRQEHLDFLKQLALHASFALEKVRKIHRLKHTLKEREFKINAPQSS